MRNLKNNIVTKFATLALAVAGIGFAGSQTFAQEAPAAPDAQAATADYQPRTAEDLQQLAGPVALYPDALLAQVLVASTYPNDVAAAAQYLQNGGDASQVATLGWDASVQGLVQAPDALNQLAGNVDWMNQLGDAFLNQQQDLMSAVQVLRQQAQTAGNLCNTPQQQVVTADNCIQIIPTDPQVIYVPVYDPGIVYVRRFGFGPCITFCPGIRVGLWLHEDFDWCDHRIYVGNWGFDRPWWHHEGSGFDYVHSHPGMYISSARGRSVSWSRQFNKPAPRHLAGPVISHVNRVNSRASNIPTRAPRANGIGLGITKTPVVHTARSTVTSHTVTNRTVTSHSVTPAVTHRAATMTGPKLATHTVRQPEVARRSVATGFHTTSTVKTTSVHTTSVSKPARQFASASTGRSAPSHQAAPKTHKK